MNVKQFTSQDWKNTSNPYPAGSVAHWTAWFLKKHERLPHAEEFPEKRFHKVAMKIKYDGKTSTSFFSRQPDSSWFDDVKALALETCDDHHHVLFANVAFFTTEDQAVVFKLKASELIA